MSVNNFATAALSVLGMERGNLLRHYCDRWISELGLQGGGDTSLTVNRYQSGGEAGLRFELKYSGNTMSTEVSPGQPFPEAFLPLFPNGWPDLAKHEGFELPKEFRKK